MKLLFKLLCVPLIFTTLVQPLNKKQSDQVKKIEERIETFNMKPVLAEYYANYEVDEITAQLHSNEFLRYMILCAIAPNNRIPLMSTHVGRFWEIFTSLKHLYATFCQQLLQQKKEIEYNACVKKGQVNPKKAQAFINDYETAFGETIPSNVWNMLPRNK